MKDILNTLIEEYVESQRRPLLDRIVELVEENDRLKEKLAKHSEPSSAAVQPTQEPAEDRQARAVSPHAINWNNAYSCRAVHCECVVQHPSHFCPCCAKYDRCVNMPCSKPHGHKSPCEQGVVEWK